MDTNSLRDMTIEGPRAIVHWFIRVNVHKKNRRPHVQLVNKDEVIQTISKVHKGVGRVGEGVDTGAGGYKKMEIFFAWTKP